MGFTKATKYQAKLRLALIGPSGSGKTYTALTLAKELGNRVALIDTEHRTASKYADEFEFDTLDLTDFDPRNYVAAIHEAEKLGYDVLIIDSLSHAWMGKNGALELVDKAAKRSQSGNSFVAWREVTPLHNDLVESMLGAKLHLIVTMRTKTEYVIETDEKTGKKVPKKVGLQPVQRDGLEYEFDVVADMDLDNNFIVSKTRCKVLNGQVVSKPDKKLAGILKAWLSDGAQEPERTKTEEVHPESSATQAHEQGKSQVETAATATAIDESFLNEFDEVSRTLEGKMKGDTAKVLRTFKAKGPRDLAPPDRPRILEILRNRIALHERQNS